MQDVKNEHKRERDSNEEEREGEHLPPWVLCFSFEQDKNNLPDKWNHSGGRENQTPAIRQTGSISEKVMEKETMIERDKESHGERETEKVASSEDEIDGDTE